MIGGQITIVSKVMNQVRTCLVLSQQIEYEQALRAGVYRGRACRAPRFDDSIVTPCEIPAGQWPMRDVMWAGFGFTIGTSTVKLYTGGQEVVVAEVVGGTKLRVRPAPGDTIDGDTGPVPISKHGSRTFVSDGVSNWITISQVGSPG
jgi:hypothetical protein